MRWELRHPTGVATIPVAWLQLEDHGVPMTYPDGKMVICMVDQRHGERLRDLLNQLRAYPVAPDLTIDQPYMDMERVPHSIGHP